MGSAWGLRVRPRAGSGIEGMLSEITGENAHIDGSGQVENTDEPFSPKFQRHFVSCVNKIPVHERSLKTEKAVRRTLSVPNRRFGRFGGEFLTR